MGQALYHCKLHGLNYSQAPMQVMQAQAASLAWHAASAVSCCRLCHKPYCMKHLGHSCTSRGTSCRQPALCLDNALDSAKVRPARYLGRLSATGVCWRSGAGSSLRPPCSAWDLLGVLLPLLQHAPISSLSSCELARPTSHAWIKHAYSQKGLLSVSCHARQQGGLCHRSGLLPGHRPDSADCLLTRTADPALPYALRLPTSQPQHLSPHHTPTLPAHPVPRTGAAFLGPSTPQPSALECHCH